MSIDWKARLKNKSFWIAMTSAVALLVQQLGFKDLLPADYNTIVNTVLSILTMLGIVVDTSTPGISDAVTDKPVTQTNDSIESK